VVLLNSSFKLWEVVRKWCSIFIYPFIYKANISNRGENKKCPLEYAEICANMPAGVRAP